MEASEYKKMYELEESHWWFTSKRKLIFSFLEKYYPDKSKRMRMLDIGCGTGIILKELSNYGEAYGVDLSEHALKFCRMRGLKNVRKGSVSNLPFKPDYFDIIGCFDVLYHKNVKDDEKALKEIARICKKGGRLLVTDSAFKSLWSRHDVASYARTRYSAEDIRQKLESAGFEIEKLTYYNFFLFPLVFLIRKLESTGERATDIKKENFLVNTLLKLVMSIERILLRFINLPFGVSIFCVARKV